jgi:predicted RNA binding protein YcfA (HicA-like mRNA interferase family)
MPRFFSGREIAKILSNKYGFKEISISGSHLKMRRENLTVIIPLHSEVKTGTFGSILKQAKIKRRDFLERSRE